MSKSSVDTAVHPCIAGWEAMHVGAVDAAQALFQQALVADPINPVALTGMGAVYQARGQLREAVLSCDAAIAAAPAYHPAWLQRGFVLSAGGSMRAARACFERVVVMDPDNVPGLAALAGVLARDGEPGRGREAAERALVLDPGNAVATCALATFEIEAGDAAAAATRLAPLTAEDTAPSEQRVTTLTLFGDALDRLRRFDDAFAAYAAANCTFATLHARTIAERPETHTAFIERLTNEVAGPSNDGPTLPDEPGIFANHLFLLGYPRSGTTLVENILASSPGVVAVEERPTLREADQLFLPPGGMARLATIGPEQADALRRNYWGRVAAATGGAQGSTFLDMDPLKGIRLPIIARLFPAARILIMRRDPRDVVWSCFRTSFALTPASMEFVTLEGVARHYDALMRHIDMCLARLPLTAHFARYDALVSDFDATTRALCKFANLPWSPELRHFDKTAQRRGVTTASGAQVRKGLYDGTRQWERYAEHLAPVLPILQPWVERFGFDA